MTSSTSSTGGSGTGTGGSLIAVGPCSANSQCVSGVCGIDGAGHCCSAACSNATAPCGATDCSADTGACIFPSGSVFCGAPGAAACVDNTLTGVSFCDGLGTCRQVADTTCQENAFCDVAGLACCTGLASSGTLRVDNGIGNDGACCGFGNEPPCRTLTRAMQLIDAARAGNVTIAATVNDGGGDWGNGETYPIALGWGVELSAAGIVFGTPNDSFATFDIKHYSTDDGIGSTSIVGASGEAPMAADGGAVVIGIVPGSKGTAAFAAIQIETNGTLHIANALLNSSKLYQTAAIVIVGGGKLVLAQDQSGAITGPVDIGSDSNGWAGIVCIATADGGCSITDADLDAGSSLTIQGQQDLDLVAEDGAVISLRSAPVLGAWPIVSGFGACGTKADAESSDGAAILLDGTASLELRNAMVQCIDGTGIVLTASSHGVPNLDLRGSTIRNTTVGIYATAGTVAVEDSTVMFNEIGVWQDVFGAVDLSGLNTVACYYGTEVGQSGGGISVFNTSSNPLDATNVAWDTAGPDLFQCNAQLDQCACESMNCTEVGSASENMDAAYISQPILTAGNRSLDTPCIPAN